MQTFSQYLAEDSAIWTPATIDHWTSYTANRKFKTEKEARDFIIHKCEYDNKQSYATVFGIWSNEKIQKFAAEAPIFKIGNSYKIGRRTLKRKAQWEGVEIKRPSIEPLKEIGVINDFDGFKIKGIKMIPVSLIHMVEHHSHTEKGITKAAAIANSIKENEWFRAIIVDQDNVILDGHHRFRAVRDMLKWSKIPCLVVEIGG